MVWPFIYDVVRGPPVVNRSVSDCEQCALSAHYTTLFVSEYKLGHALPRFRLRTNPVRALGVSSSYTEQSGGAASAA